MEQLGGRTIRRGAGIGGRSEEVYDLACFLLHGWSFYFLFFYFYFFCDFKCITLDFGSFSFSLFPSLRTAAAPATRGGCFLLHNDGVFFSFLFLRSEMMTPPTDYIPTSCTRRPLVGRDAPLKCLTCNARLSSPPWPRLPWKTIMYYVCPITRFRGSFFFLECRCFPHDV